MKYPALAIYRIKAFNLFGKIRRSYFHALGLKLGKDVTLGKINCDWPFKVSIGHRSVIQDGVTLWIKNPFDSNNRIEIGNNVFIGRNTEFNCSCKITIGDNCLIASNTIMADINHTIKKGQLIASQSIISEEIIVEEDVWVGAGSVVLKGVRLGKGCVIAAGSVVNKSIPAYEIWAGVPAKKIGERK